MDGEDTTLVVMDTWEAEKRVWHSKQDLEGGMLSLVPDSCPLLGHETAGTGRGHPQQPPKPTASKRPLQQRQKNLMTPSPFLTPLTPSAAIPGGANTSISSSAPSSHCPPTRTVQRNTAFSTKMPKGNPPHLSLPYQSCDFVQLTHHPQFSHLINGLIIPAFLTSWFFFLKFLTNFTAVTTVWSMQQC